MLLDRKQTEELTEVTVIEFVNAAKTFTPWEITEAIRAKGDQVEHLFVREWTRNMMFAAIGAGLLYDYETRQYPHPSGQGTVDALTFFPVPAVVPATQQTAAASVPSVTDQNIWSL